jgi:hypothetical protein
MDAKRFKNSVAAVLNQSARRRRTLIAACGWQDQMTSQGSRAQCVPLPAVSPVPRNRCSGRLGLSECQEVLAWIRANRVKRVTYSGTECVAMSGSTSSRSTFVDWTNTEHSGFDASWPSLTATFSTPPNRGQAVRVLRGTVSRRQELGQGAGEVTRITSAG